MNKFRQLAPRLIVAALAVGAGYYYFSQKPIYRFSGLNGPTQVDQVKPAQPTPISRFTAGADSRLAVLITDPESDWLGLAHGLRTAGIPFVLTQKTEEALKHRMVLAYPTISGKVLDARALQALAAFPQAGGTLVGFDILGGGLNETFGIGGAEPSRSHHTMRIEDGEAPAFGLAEAEEQIIPLAGKNVSTSTYSFPVTSGKVVARYDDGSAAIVSRDFGTGRSIAIGLDFGAYLTRAYNGRQEFDGAYINAYRPAVDTVLRTLRALYRAAEPLAVTVGTVPEGKALSLIMTHDIDYGASLQNAVKYAELEKKNGVKGTYFVQTKYVRDWNDESFFNEGGAALTRQLSDAGMEIASHSVSHSLVFARFPLGDGQERYPAYVPFVKSKTETRDGTILGELRVSRFLLETEVPGLKVASFRPGHLEYPFALPQALEATGYRFSSSVASGTAATHLPFRLNDNRENRAETPIFEFPITIEDELQRPMTSRLPAAITILQRLKAYGGMCVVLIHPNVFDDKLEFEEALLPEAKKMGAWQGTLNEFGTWWAARDTVGIDVKRDNGRIVVDATAAAPFDRLAFEVPAAWTLDKSAAGNAGVHQSGNRIVMDRPAQALHLVFVPGA
jgi:peptidoglycan/xylan/chitin deacetylase (PgdA/CDA1 family)